MDIGLGQTCLWVFECLLQMHGSAVGLLWGQGLQVQQTEEAQCVSLTTEPPNRQPINWRSIIPEKSSHCYESSKAHNRFPNMGIQHRDWEPSGNLPLKASGIWLQNFHGTGERDLEGTNKTLCTLGTRRKEQWPSQETEADLPVRAQESPGEAWVNMAIVGWVTLNTAVLA